MVERRRQITLPPGGNMSLRNSLTNIHLTPVTANGAQFRVSNQLTIDQIPLPSRDRRRVNCAHTALFVIPDRFFVDFSQRDGKSGAFFVKKFIHEYFDVRRFISVKSSPFISDWTDQIKYFAGVEFFWGCRGYRSFSQKSRAP
jgi:hypothetical protein